MTRLLRRAAAALTLAISVVCQVPSATAEGADTFELVGTGTVYPGFPTFGCLPQSLAFSGVLSLVAGDETVGSQKIATDVHYEGYSTGCETIEGGAGTGALSGGPLPVTGVVSYQRIGTTLTLAGTVAIDGNPHELTATCTWVWTSVLASIYYTITCSGVFTDIPLPTTPGDVGPFSDSAQVVGGGTISPGLQTTGCVVQPVVTFDSTVAVIEGDDTIDGAIHFQGSSDTSCETLNSGQGSGELSGMVSGTVTYSRTSGIVTLGGRVTARGEEHAVLAGLCIFSPTSFNPVTSYALACAVELIS